MQSSPRSGLRNSGSLLVAATFLLLGQGCDCGDNFGEDIDAGDIDAPPPDAAPDAPVCDTPDPGAVGGACSDADSCDVNAAGGGFCFNDSFAPAYPSEGMCTIFGCTIDDDCGAGSTCALLPDGGGGLFGACFPACCDGVVPGLACSPERLCADSLFGDPIMTDACVPGTPGVADGDECVNFAQCDESSVCRNDPFQFPGGQCATLKCTSDADCAQAGDGRCVDLADLVAPVCVDDCDVDADCREGDGYRCIDHGGTIGKFCEHPAPGDNCTVDADCGLVSDPWVCRTGGTYPGGYCTVEDCDTADNDTCPIFSFCVSLMNEANTFCADECETPGVDMGCGTGYTCTVITIPGTGARNVCLPDGSTVLLP